MRFQATIRDAAGETRQILREAPDANALSTTLRAEGSLLLKVTPWTMQQAQTQALPPWWHPAWVRPITGFDVETALRQVAAMLRGGVTLTQALTSVAEQAPTPRLRRLWQDVAARVVSGESFSRALAPHARQVGEITLRLVETGEKSGELERVLVRAAGELEAHRDLRGLVLNALAYPVMAVAMAVGVSAYLVIAVIPKVTVFLEAGGVKLPPLTQMLVDISTAVQAHGLKALGACALVGVAWALVRLSKTGREKTDAFLLHLPVSGRILRLSGTALFARAMQIMTESGVTITDALATARDLLANKRFAARVNAAYERVLRGETLSQALAQAPEFMPMLRRMAAVGEVSGSFAETFRETARFHETLLTAAVRRFGRIIEPVMIIITGGITGFVYVAFFMAVFALAGTH